MEKVAAFAEDAAQHFGDGELAVGDGMADGVGDSRTGLQVRRWWQAGKK